MILPNGRTTTILITFRNRLVSIGSDPADVISEFNVFLSFKILNISFGNNADMFASLLESADQLLSNVYNHKIFKKT